MPSFALLDPAQHDRAGFMCGEPSLDKYLREQAMQHHREGISTTHVLIDDSAPSFIGHDTLAAAQRAPLAQLHPADQKRLPRYPVPAVRMALFSRLRYPSRARAMAPHSSRMRSYAASNCASILACA